MLGLIAAPHGSAALFGAHDPLDASDWATWRSRAFGDAGPVAPLASADKGMTRGEAARVLYDSAMLAVRRRSAS